MGPSDSNIKVYYVYKYRREVELKTECRMHCTHTETDTPAPPHTHTHTHTHTHLVSAMLVAITIFLTPGGGLLNTWEKRRRRSIEVFERRTDRQREREENGWNDKQITGDAVRIAEGNTDWREIYWKIINDREKERERDGEEESERNPTWVWLTVGIREWRGIITNRSESKKTNNLQSTLTHE